MSLQGTTQIAGQAANVDAIDTIVTDATQALRTQHKIKAGADDDFGVTAQKDVLQSFQQTIGMLTIFLAVIDESAGTPVFEPGRERGRARHDRKAGTFQLRHPVDLWAHHRMRAKRLASGAPVRGQQSKIALIGFPSMPKSEYAPLFLLSNASRSPSTQSS